MIDKNRDAEAGHTKKITRKREPYREIADKLTCGTIILLIFHLLIWVHTIRVTQIFWGRTGIILLGLVVNAAAIFMLVDIQKLRKIQEK